MPTSQKYKNSLLKAYSYSVELRSQAGNVFVINKTLHNLSFTILRLYSLIILIVCHLGFE